MIKIQNVFFISLIIGLFSSTSYALDVKITKDVSSVIVKHHGKDVKIMRNQNTDHHLTGGFTKTSRPCPPFCFQPMHAAKGVETIGEVELIHFLQQELNRGTGLLIDARVPKWYMKGTIPGSINIPFTAFNPKKSPKQLARALKLLGVKQKGESSGFFSSMFGKKSNSNWNFRNAKTLALFCNGSWCGQSPAAIKNLISIGYPPEKLRYYRGGMNMWQIGGFTTISPKASTAWQE